MKLGSLKDGRDGRLVVVSKNLTRAVEAGDIAPTLQAALDDWEDAAPRLNALYRDLNAGETDGAFDLDAAKLASPLPRGYQFLDGSAYLPHVERVRKARGAEMPPSFLEDPLMYQAVTDGFLGPRDPIYAASEDHGIDFEAEVGVLTSDIPMAASAEQCAEHIELLVLINDVSLRKLIPAELAKGFGFLQGKPRSALSPVAVTPDELGNDWREGKVHLPLLSHLNGELFGRPECGEDMQFNFPQLLAHAARTRPLAAGTLLGGGTIANKDESRGSSCLAEKRVLEVIRDGKPTTPFLSFGDRVRIEMLDGQGDSIFGAIEQEVARYE